MDSELTSNPAELLVRILERAKAVGDPYEAHAKKNGTAAASALRVWRDVFASDRPTLARSLGRIPLLAQEVRTSLIASGEATLQYVGPTLDRLDTLILIPLGMDWPEYWQQHIGDSAIQVLGSVMDQVGRSDDLQVRVTDPSGLAQHLVDLRATVREARPNEIDEVLRTRLLRYLTALIDALNDPGTQTSGQFVQIVEALSGMVLGDHTTATKLMASKPGKAVLGVLLAFRLSIVPGMVLGAGVAAEAHVDSKVSAAIESNCTPQRELGPGPSEAGSQGSAPADRGSD